MLPYNRKVTLSLWENKNGDMEKIRIIEQTVYSDVLCETVRYLSKQLTSSKVMMGKDDLTAIIEAVNSHLFIVYCEDEPAGMLTLGDYVTPTGHKAWIEDVVIDEAFRGKALGKELVEYAITYARSIGVKTLMLTSRPSRVAANRLYQKVGFLLKETNLYKMDL